jgi:hypothetical protein
MKQAKATYRTDRGQRILDFAAGTPAGWAVRPHVHLAYWHASIPERVYLTCHLDLDEYVHRWLGEDFEKVGGHHRDQVGPVLWPWLLKRGYAGASDDESKLPGFLHRLVVANQDLAHLRLAIRIERTWSGAEAASLNQRGAMAGELRAAITELLGVLKEPLPPACAAPLMAPTAEPGARSAAG